MSNISYAFDGRTVVVTGSARGIGKEVARLFVEARAAVYLMDPDADEVNRAADELGATAIVGNVSSTEDAESAIAQMISDTGRVASSSTMQVFCETRSYGRLAMQTGSRSSRCISQEPSR